MGRGGSQKAEAKELSPYRMAIEQSAEPFVRILRERQPHQHFTDEEKQAVLAVLVMVDGNIGRASRLTGLPISSLWHVKDANMGAFLEQREVWKRKHAIRSQDVADMTLEKLAENIETADLSPRDAAVTWGILVQRGMDLAGEGATITHHHKLSVDPAALLAITERLRAIRPVEDEVIEAEFRVVDE